MVCPLALAHGESRSKRSASSSLPGEGLGAQSWGPLHSAVLREESHPLVVGDTTMSPQDLALSSGVRSSNDKGYYIEILKLEPAL